ncbi:MAG: thioredoxin family protein [Balneolales bacterium]|nr:thioredoxin family protein [Balneolales bacterium]
MILHQNLAVKRVFSLIVLFLGLFVFAGSLNAQPVTSASKVDVTTQTDRETILAGSEVQTVVRMSIDDNWHINSNRPTLEWLIGTVLTLDLPENVQVVDIQYPAYKEFEFSFAEGQPLHVYEGDAPIFLTLSIDGDAPLGLSEITGNLRVQACDDMTCLAPSNIPISFSFNVTDSEDEVSEVRADLFDDYVPGDGDFVTFDQAGEANQIASLIDDSGLLWTFVIIFFIGLALNLTPCVYPMISVTVSIFGGQDDSNITRVFFKALTYVLGIATMYSVLGVVAALSGGLFGGILQSPFVLAGIGILLLGLALSMFGLYDIQMPYWLTSKLGGQNASGFIGVYISGLVVGVFAAPCIGPPIIALLAFVGAKGDPVFGFWSFFILSMGLGFPYLILGTFSGLLQKLPKSGVWMVWVKKVFGIVLVGVGLFYLGLAFFPKFTPWVIAITLLAGGIYLGFIERSGLDKLGFKLTKWTVGLVGIIFGIMMVMNLQKEGVEWDMYTTEKFETAISEGQPIVLDFYADWCIPCLELDRVTFVNPDVINELDDFVRLKVDLTNFDSPESEELRQQFNIIGVPTIVFIDVTGEEVNRARVTGFLNPTAFLEKVSLVDTVQLAD